MTPYAHAATVEELMDRTLHRTTVETTVAEAATIMVEAQVGSTLVMDGERLLGIFTERDVVRALAESPESQGRPIGRWMTAEPQTIAPTARADEALRRMVSKHFRHLPVVDEQGLVIGMLSLRDLARFRRAPAGRIRRLRGSVGRPAAPAGGGAPP